MFGTSSTLPSRLRGGAGYWPHAPAQDHRARRAEALLADGIVDLFAFGRRFIFNPSLMACLRNAWPIAEADPATFYPASDPTVSYDRTAEGYIDYSPHQSLSGTERGRFLLETAAIAAGPHLTIENRRLNGRNGSTST